MGWLISQFSNKAIALVPGKWQRRLTGTILSLSLILGSAAIGWAIAWSLSQIHPGLGIAAQIIMLASCFAGKSLRVAAFDVLQPLTAGDLVQARSRLSLYVGRDTAKLTESEILRAVLETVGENAVDGVTAPLFYGILGAFFSPLAIAPLALAYKAASTLDSMLGYLREPYTDLGWFCAQLEDYLTWFPCRLTVLTLSLFSGRPLAVLTLCRRDAIKDPSPNSGWSECVYAAILNVQLGGVNTYQGEVKEKPLLGEPSEPISGNKINQALFLTRCCFLLWLAIACLLMTT